MVKLKCFFYKQCNRSGKEVITIESLDDPVMLKFPQVNLMQIVLFSFGGEIEPDSLILSQKHLCCKKRRGQESASY